MSRNCYASVLISFIYRFSHFMHLYWFKKINIQVDGKRSGYCRQTTNELTGEHSCIMLHSLHSEVTAKWLVEYWADFRRRFISLLAYQFHTFPTSLALSIVVNKAANSPQQSKLCTHLIKPIETVPENGTCFLTNIFIIRFWPIHIILPNIHSKGDMPIHNSYHALPLLPIQPAFELGLVA